MIMMTPNTNNTNTNFNSPLQHIKLRHLDLKPTSSPIVFRKRANPLVTPNWSYTPSSK